MKEKVNWDKAAEDIGPRLFRYFRVRFNEEQADDLTQDTLIRLLRKVELGSFDPEKGSLRMLAFGIAHFVALEKSRQLRKEQMTSIEETDATTDSAESQFIERSSLNLLRAAIRELSEQEQQILSLMIDEEMKLSEISLLLQSPTGTIKSHIHRAKQKLKKLISKESAHERPRT